MGEKEITKKKKKKKKNNNNNNNKNNIAFCMISGNINESVR